MLRKIEADWLAMPSTGGQRVSCVPNAWGSGRCTNGEKKRQL
jgi:hypothetical protein